MGLGVGYKNNSKSFQAEGGSTMWNNNLTELLHIQFPIIQAPMAGGPTTVKLVAEVANFGGLGTIAAGYLSPEQLRDQIKAVKLLTKKQFAVNLFVPSKYTVDTVKVKESLTLLKPILSKLSIPEEYPTLPDYETDLTVFYDQLKVIVEENIRICTFTFGVPSADILARLKNKSTVVIGTATTVNEAIINERAGMDAVVVQGSEAGGHRGSFEQGHNEGLIGLMSLIPQVADSIKIPVIAAGGIMDARGLIAARMLGANGVQMGTAFLTCKESGANQAHKEAILKASEDQAVLTNSFSGKLARGIKNQFIVDMDGKEHVIPEYPIQNQLTKGIRKQASTLKNSDYMSLWAGQSPRLSRDVTVKELLNKMIFDAEKILNEFSN
jgi:nitronate monooxygenase